MSFGPVRRRPPARPSATLGRACRLAITSLLAASSFLVAAPNPPATASPGNAGPAPSAAGSVTTAPAPDPAVEVVHDALAASKAVDLRRWAYTVTTVVDGRKSIEHHNPAAARGSRWQLALKDDQKPSAQDLQKYAEKRRRPGSDPRQPEVHDLIDAKSLQVLSNDATRVTCSFRLKVSDPDSQSMMEKLHGTLVARKDPPALEMVEIVNTGRLSKQPVFSLSEFKARLEFQPGPDGSQLLPGSLHFRLRGRALLLKSLNKDISTTFSDFRAPPPR
jgi:hypothetical protein